MTEQRTTAYVLAWEAENILRTALWNRDSTRSFAVKNPNSIAAREAWAKAEDNVADSLAKVRRLLA